MSKRIFSRHREPTQLLNGDELVRAHFGLSQQDLAQLLGVSRAAVAMSERLERGLPAGASGRYARLTVALAPLVTDGPLPPYAGPAPALAAHERQTLDLRRRGLELAAYPLRQALARCHTRLAQAALRQRALPALRAAFAADDARAQRWLAFFEEEAADTLQSHGTTPALLELRLRVLAFEAAEIGRLLGTDGAA